MKNLFHHQVLAVAGMLFWLVFGGTALGQNQDTNADTDTATASSHFEHHFNLTASPAFGLHISGSEQDQPTIFSDFVLEQGKTNMGDAVVIKGNSTINGVLSGDSVTILGNATINGQVTGDVTVVLGSLKLGPKAEVAGDVVVVGGKLERAPGARTKNGDTEVLFPHIPGFERLMTWLKDGLLKGRPFPPRVGWVWIVAGICLGVNLLLLMIFPRAIQASVNTMESKAVVSFFTGVLAKMLVGLLTVLLCVTMIGILAVPFLGVAYLVASLFGKITTYRYVGQQLGKWLRLGLLQHPAAALIAGTVVFYLLYMAPILGFVAWGFAGTFGLGAVVLSTVQQFRAGWTKPPASTAPAAFPTAAPVYAEAAFSGAPPMAPAQPASAAFPPQNISPPMLAAALPRAGFWIRFFALALDAALFFIVFGVFVHSSMSEGNLLGLDRQDVCLILWLIYHVALWTWKGTTIGGIIAGIRVVRLDGRPLDFPVALIRALASVLSFFVLGLGFFWVGFSKDKQSWHDKIAGTVIIKAPPGMALA